ncbi:CoA synthetase [Alphaproteobacteria bacterium]|jgi:glutaconate CoA-transferase subunit A|nr:CoA synthetase [Alphaproteobacteria bacterium]MDC0969447.1 CoA synthetase [Alphaproteobacteria bacterium]
MKSFEEFTVKEIVDQIEDGILLGIPADYSGVPMTFTKKLINKGVKNLKLYCLPLTTIQGDMLIGSGCVSEIETAAVTLGEFGLAPRFSEAVENGKILIKDSTCPALHAQLQATEKSVPFMPLRGVVGSDVQKNRKDWQIISNPMKSSGVENEPILLLPAVQLDVLVFHASYADRNGNIQIGRRRELATLAHASKKVFVTVEEILDTDFFENELSAATCLPALYIDGISVVKNGAWPCKLPGVYESDNDEIKKYSIAAKTQPSFNEYMKQFLKS